ncbi:MAG: response regulator [Ruminiclostridium sp.]|nr:response regulator [Ruminiclostridium sp.]
MKKILAVDDEKLMLDALTTSIRGAAPDAEIFPFQRPGEALEFARETPLDVAFLDIRMRGMSGMELATALLGLYPEINIIFCTSYDEYVSEAFRDIRCNGYITKPVDVAAVAHELSHLRVPLKQEQGGDSIRVKLRCIGRFEVFVDGEPLKFENARTKEVLAYLVNAYGGICNNQEIISVLWEDLNRHDSYFKKIRKDLIDTLEGKGCGDILFRQRGGLGINVDRVDCDYYDWKKENPEQGLPSDYMNQFAWAYSPDFE